MGYAGSAMYHGMQILDQNGTQPLIGTGTLAISVAAFLYFIWLFIQTLRTAIREWPIAPPSDMTPRNLHVRFGESFREPSKDFGPAYRWGMLAAALLLLAWDMKWQLNRSPAFSGDRYGNLVTGLLLLLNHLAWSCRFPPTVTFALRVLASGWFLLACAYIFAL